jgi:hypothetical protein
MTANAILAGQHYAKRALHTTAPPTAPVRKLLVRSSSPPPPTADLWRSPPGLTHDTLLQRWLESFGAVFGEPCRGCKRLLYNDSEHLLFLPPTWRTLDKKKLPYHPQCLAAFPNQ